MNISPEFIKAMGVCDEALLAYVSQFGEEPQAATVAQQAMAIAEAEQGAEGWVDWCENLKTDLLAIRWWGNAIEAEQWKVECPHTGPAEFTTYAEAVAHRIARVDDEIPADLFDINSFDNGVVSDFHKDAPSYLIGNPLTGINEVVLSAHLQDKLDALTVEYKDYLSGLHPISRKIIDPVDNYFAWEPV